MATKVKKIKKNTVKQADEFISLSDRILKEIIKNRKFVIFTFISIILAFSLSFIYAKHRAFKTKESFKHLSPALKAYHDLTPQSKKKDTDSILKQFESVIKDFEGTAGASYAQLYKGHIKYKNGNFEEAESIYKNVLNSTNQNNKIYIFAKEGLVNTYIALKKHKKALALLNAILISENTVSKRNTYMTIASIQEESGDKNLAAKTLQKVINEFPDNRENKEIKNRIEELTAKTNTP